MKGEMIMKEELVINANLPCKEPKFITRTCVVEKAIAVSHTDFERLISESMKDNNHISNNVDLMYCDKDEIIVCWFMIKNRETAC